MRKSCCHGGNRPPQGMLLLCVLFTTHADFVSMLIESLFCAGLRDSCGDEWVRARCASSCDGPDAGTRQVAACTRLLVSCVFSCGSIGSGARKHAGAI